MKNGDFPVRYVNAYQSQESQGRCWVARPFGRVTPRKEVLEKMESGRGSH